MTDRSQPIPGSEEAEMVVSDDIKEEFDDADVATGFGVQEEAVPAQIQNRFGFPGSGCLTTALLLLLLFDCFERW